MSSRINLRVTAAERKKLLEIQQDRGCKSLSQAVRLLMGFPQDGGPEQFDGADDVDSVGRLADRVLQWTARLDDQHEILSRIATYLKIPKTTRNGSFEDGAPTVDEAMLIDFPTRGGHQHPELPAGFAR